MKIAISKKSGKLVIDLEGETLTKTVKLYNLKNFVFRNAEVSTNKEQCMIMRNNKTSLIKDCMFTSNSFDSTISLDR